MSFPFADFCRPALFSTLLATTGRVHADDTDARLAGDCIVEVKSGYSFDETIERLKQDIAARGQETMLGKCLVAPFRRPLPPLSGIRRRVPFNRLQSDQGHKQMWLRECIMSAVVRKLT
jgi:hypothetical protein